MKTKLMCIVFMFVLVFSLSACGNSQEDINNSENGITTGTLQSEKDNSLGNMGNESADNKQFDETTSPQNSDTSPDTNVQAHTETGSVDSSVFSGKVSGCYYADDNMIIVAADKLYLYDTQNGKSIASVDISLRDLCVQTYSDGYFVVGQESGGNSNGSFMTTESSNGMKGYLLSKDFAIENTISFNGLLGNDFVLSTAGIAISENGKKVAIGGLQGLYLYDTSTQKVSTILDYSKDGMVNNTQILTIESLAFTGDKNLLYTGTGTDRSNGGNGFSVYGTVSIDNAKLSITKKAGYEVGEMQKGGNLLIMPQSLNKNNGTLLMLDITSNTEKTMTFSSSSEGRDGVFCSQQGKYVATSTLADNSVTIKIYDTVSGKVVHTETATDSNSTYFLRVPQILILDGSNTCIVILGRGISEVSTLITSFGFEG